jgi:hypothetical protein
MFFIYTETNVKGMQSHFSMPFEQNGNSPVRSCLIASRGAHMIWDSAHDLLRSGGVMMANIPCYNLCMWRHIPRQG